MTTEYNLILGVVAYFIVGLVFKGMLNKNVEHGGLLIALLWPAVAIIGLILMIVGLAESLGEFLGKKFL